MFRSILVPLDGSALAARAVPYAALVAAGDATVTLVGVVHPLHDLSGLSPDDSAEEEARMRDLLAHELAAAGRSVAGTSVSLDIRTGDAAAEIIAAAADHRSDVIVMTTHGGNGRGYWTFGSVAQRVMRHAPVSVLTVRPDMDGPPHAHVAVRRIVLPLDGSHLAAQAIPAAQYLASRLGLPVDVIRVFDDRRTQAVSFSDFAGVPVEYWEEKATDERKEARDYTEEVARQFADAGVIANAHLLCGDPATALDRYLTDKPDALVVMTTHGRRGVGRWLLGSVAEKLVSHVRGPVLMLRSTQTTG